MGNSPIGEQVNQDYVVFDGEDGADDEYLCSGCAEAEGGDTRANDPCYRWAAMSDECT